VVSRPAKPKRQCARCDKALSAKRQRMKYCYLCDVAVKKERAERGHRVMVARMYGIAVWVYDRLLEIQGGRCAICQRAKGIARRLAVDHDHSCCPELPACGKCVRGLLCKTCNRIIGHARDDPAFFLRGYDYLINPPARQVIHDGHELTQEPQ
jgi:hypothetical protein